MQLYNMNYLAHAYLSFGAGEILTGNMIADHVKGKKALDTFPEGIKQGIILHRHIDEFTDMHPATLRAKIWFREDYRLYAGAILDSLYDHFLANDPRHFADSTALKEFAQDTYRKLETNAAYFPEGFKAYFPHMRDHDWLSNYRNVVGMKRPLDGLARRAKYMPSADKAYEIFITNYYALNQCFFELMDDLVPFVKRALTN